MSIDRFVRAFFVGGALHALETSWTDIIVIGGRELRGRAHGHPHVRAIHKFLDSVGC
jgi:hypothetical protein